MGFWGTPKINTDRAAVDELLTRAVASVIPKELAIKKLTSGERLRVYLGIDPTGAKLHLGHSVPLRKLKAFSDLGHEVIFLVGSFTAMIGDPSGRDAMREPLTREKIRENFKDYKRQASKILDFSKITVRYNHEWLEKLGFEDIVKLAGNFTVQQMLKRDMFHKRIEEGNPIGLHEFLYPLMVGYDSVVLDVDAELGGSDQEFNILAGRHLQQAMGKRDKFVLTTRLIEGSDGRKMSKTYGNCVYFDDEPSEMFGKVMSIKDELMKLYFETLTDVPMQEVEAITSHHPKDAKFSLAKDLVTIYHGRKAAMKAAEDWINTFSKGEVPMKVMIIEKLPEETFMASAVSSGIVKSNTEFRHLIVSGAVSSVLSGEKILDPNYKGQDKEVIRIGKHRFAKIKEK
ncbi:MAG: tyrosine--tRNA ligase [Patescibacteria group bacterium]|nr:tyrosine--tRNA ligase [Patescibacteria group bacterium]